MKSLIRQTGKTGRKGLALVLVIAMLMSICAVGFLVTASAATQLNGTMYLDISKNSNWKNKTIVASFDGSSATATFSGSGDMLSAYVPSGISSSSKMTLTAYPAGFPIDLANSASPYVYRVIWSSASGKSYVYGWTDSNNNGWPGYQGISSGSYYYYDFSTKYENVIFSNNGNSQSADLELMSKYFGTYGNVAYYDGSSFVVPRSTTVTISSLTSAQNLFVMNSNDSASVSKYQYNGNIVTNTKTLYLYNPDWSTAYVTYDLSDAYQVTKPMRQLTSGDGVKYFVIENTVPEKATIRFSSSATGTANSSGILSVPSDDKVLYIMESQKYWTTLSNLPKEINRIPEKFGPGIYGVTATYYDYLEDQEITNGYMNANTYTWWLRYGKLNRAITNYSRAKGIKTPLYFGNLNTASGDVNSETGTYYNYQNIANNSGSLRNFWYAVQGLASHSLIGDQIYAPTVTGGAAAMPIFDEAWLTDGSSNGNGMGSALAKVYQSYFPFVESKVGDVTTYSFDSSGGGKQNNGVVTGKNRYNSDNVYFTWDGDTPKSVHYGYGSEFAVTDGGKEFSIYDTVGWGIFPFNNTSTIRQVTSSGDPIKIPPNEIWIKSNYGTVACYAWTPGGGNTGTPQALPKNQYGYYYMNTTYTGYTNFLLTSAAGNWDANKTEDLDFSTYPKGRAYVYNGNSFSNNLNYGFGIRLDMDFRVPENGTLPNGKPVTFDYAGDDDLWVYISDDAGNSELVLDLGGDHKFTSGSINFNTMKSTADYVHTNYNTNYDEYPAVPADEFWIAKTYYDAYSNPQTYSNLYVKTWDKTDKNGNTIDSYYVPFETSTYTFSNGQQETFFKFKTSILGTSTAITANTAQSTASEVGGIEDVTNIGGKALVFRYRNNANKAETYVVSSGSTATGTVTKPFLGGQPLNPNKTYHMTVFYMERGLIESNFKVNFTMTPVKNDLLVDKVVEVPDDINNDAIADAVLENDTFNYTSTNNGYPANGKTYTYTQQDGSSTNSRTGSNGSFSLKDSESAYFTSQFDTGSSMSVTETSISSDVSLSNRYSTRWELFKNGKSIDKQNNSTTANFNLGSEDDTETANMQLTYTNTLKTDKIVLNKKVQNQGGQDITSQVTQDFKFNIQLDIDGTGYKTYPLYYKVGNTQHYTEDGTFSFAPQNVVTIEGLPVGTSYKITETVPSGYVVDSNGKTGVVGKNGTVGFVNTQSTGSGTVTIGKKLDGTNYTGNQFSFTMQGLRGPSNSSKNYIDVSSKKYTANSVANGVVTFNIEFSEVGWYRFKITEDAVNRSLVGYSGDSTVYYVEFQVIVDTSDANKLKINKANMQFYSDEFFTIPYVGTPAFQNETEHASIRVKKDDQAGNPLTDTQFAVIKVKSETALSVDQINALIAANQNLLKGSTTKPAGQDTASVLFENLPIYQNGDKIYNQATGRWEDGQNYLSGNAVPQTYLVFEYSAKNGYNTDKTTRFVTFPHENQYNITFDYTNVAVVMPKSSGEGMFLFLVVGLGIMGTGALIAAAYYANGKLRRKKSRHVYHDK